jgi:putative nucleotidyltransferase with HDIG domain
MGDTGPRSDLVTAIESDVSLTTTALRMANQVAGPHRGRVDSVVAAIEVLSPAGVHALASRARTYDFFERAGNWELVPDRFRLHAGAVQRVAERIANVLGYPHRDRLIVSALLHDIGKLVLVHAYGGYPSEVHGDARTPEERLARERRELGVDHALVGGVLARRWGLPRTIAAAVERHHSDDATEDAAIVRLADILAHYEREEPVAPSELLAAARRVNMNAVQLRAVLYDLPHSHNPVRQRVTEPCPLSDRELDVLRQLAEGKVYKQIAHELMLSTSTVRTHLHNVYGKLGAVDRAQAVLMATERGWL